MYFNVFEVQRNLIESLNRASLKLGITWSDLMFYSQNEFKTNNSILFKCYVGIFLGIIERRIRIDTPTVYKLRASPGLLVVQSILDQTCVYRLS